MRPGRYVTITCTMRSGPRNGRMARARMWNGMLPTFATTKRRDAERRRQDPDREVHDHDHAEVDRVDADGLASRAGGPAPAGS